MTQCDGNHDGAPYADPECWLIPHGMRFVSIPVSALVEHIIPEHVLIEYKWYTTGAGSIGIVLVRDPEKLHRTYIGPCMYMQEKIDAACIVAHGGKFLDGRLLWPHISNWAKEWSAKH